MHSEVVTLEDKYPDRMISILMQSREVLIPLEEVFCNNKQLTVLSSLLHFSYDCIELKISLFLRMKMIARCYGHRAMICYIAKVCYQDFLEIILFHLFLTFIYLTIYISNIYSQNVLIT